jgi:F1F0 ATPase subunit 2
MTEFTWLAAGLLCLEFAAGIGLGLIYFRTLWWTTQRLCTDGRPVLVITLMIGRFALLGGMLYFASLAGALPLLAVASGILLARALVLRHVRAAAP